MQPHFENFAHVEEKETRKSEQKGISRNQTSHVKISYLGHYHVKLLLFFIAEQF